MIYEERKRMDRYFLNRNTVYQSVIYYGIFFANMAGNRRLLCREITKKPVVCATDNNFYSPFKIYLHETRYMKFFIRRYVRRCWLDILKDQKLAVITLTNKL